MFALRVVRVAVAAGLVALPATGCGGARASSSDHPSPAGTSARDSAAGDTASRARRAGAASVGVLQGEELARQRVTRVEELFQGRVAGVHVVRTSGGGYQVRIRGTKTFLGSDEPLFVIDGMPIMSASPGAALEGINAHDVARIEVLKDAAALAMYGSRGANGVILITTKRRD
jgi:TonB-dependent SusC/RagA subfamily outer membrane receptor